MPRVDRIDYDGRLKQPMISRPSSESQDFSGNKQR